MNPEFSASTRKEIINAMDGGEYEVTIIGGGITGSGIANILAENGVHTLLIEKGDFASGTSSGSSKLIHGGLRYLQNGRLIEVHRLLKERNYLLGHTDIVKPIEFHIFTGKDMWNSFELGLGISLYNILSGKLPYAKHIKNEGEYPGKIEGYYSYMDGITVDSKLVIYNVASAHRHGAVCLNYMEATSIKNDGKQYKVSMHDKISGENKTINTKIIINAAGPWGNRILEMAGLEPDKNFRLSKGVHIVFPYSAWGRKNAAVFRSAIDGRQLFIIPAGEVVYAGTTDTFVDNPEDFSINNNDIKYRMAFKNVAPVRCSVEFTLTITFPPRPVSMIFIKYRDFPFMCTRPRSTFLNLPPEIISGISFTVTRPIVLVRSDPVPAGTGMSIVSFPASACIA